MLVLITGAGGQLGRAVARDAARRRWTVHAATHAELPIDDATAVQRAVEDVGPDLVVNCAAWTDVDGCQRDPQRAQRINADGAGHLAAACAAAGASLLQVSTDYVFDGTATEPYRATDPVDPRSAYGRSKLAGERQILDSAVAEHSYIVRTSWLFGPGGRCFPRTILDAARAGRPLRVVDDQFGCPTMTVDLAAALLDLSESGAAPGIYHAANRGHTSWREFAVELLRQTGIAAEVAGMSSAELDRPAPRPAWSVLDCTKLTAVRGAPLPTWQDALARWLAEEPR